MQRGPRTRHRAGDHQPRDAGRKQSAQHDAADTEAAIELLHPERRDQEPHATHHPDRANRARRERQIARREQDHDGEIHELQKLPDREPPRERTQDRIVPDQLQALFGVFPHGRVFGKNSWRVTGLWLYAFQHPRRRKKRDGIEQDGKRCRQPMDKNSRQTGADELRTRIGKGNARVGFDKIFTTDTLRHEYLIRRPADDATNTNQKPHDIKHRHRQPAEPRRNRNGEQRQTAADIGHDNER